MRLGGYDGGRKLRDAIVRRMFPFFFWGFVGVAWTVAFAICAVVYIVTLPFDRNLRVLHYCSCFSLFMYVYLNPLWRVKVVGRGKLPLRGPAILVSNHQSSADIAVLAGLYRPFKWVAKESLFNVPLMGWTMRMNNYVRLARGDRRSIIQMMRDCMKWLERGVPVMIFPEGTRSLDGNLQEFNPGAFKLATRTGCPIYPIVVEGTARALPKYGAVVRHEGDITVRVLDPVDPSEFGKDTKALTAHVQEKMRRELETLRRERAGAVRS